MNIKHCDLLSWVHEKTDAQNTKTMRKIARRCSLCEISIRRSCHGLHVSNGVHPSDGTGILPVSPSGRIAAGHAAWTLNSTRLKNAWSRSGHAKNARDMRA
jgi:hypothetical protein